MKGTGIIFTMIKKEFRHIFRDVMSCALLFIMPVAIIIIFGYALSFEVNHFNIAVINTSHEAAGERLFARLDANEKLHIAERIERYDQIDAAMARNNTRAVVAYGKNGIDLFIDSYASSIQTQCSRIIGSIIRDFAKDEFNVPPTTDNEPIIRFLYNPSSNNKYMPVPGLILMVFILVSSIVLGTSVNKEKEQGTFKLLRLAPMNNIELLAGKSIPYFLISLIHVSAVYFICRHFDIEIVGNLALFLGICILFSVCCMSLGLLIGTWFDRPLDVVILCWIVLFIPNIFLSGFIFPISGMEGTVRLVIDLLPGTSFINAFRSIAYKGNGFMDTLQPISILGGETIVATSLALAALKWRKDK